MQNENEQTKYYYEVNREHAMRAHDLNSRSSFEFTKAAIESANVAIRAMLLVNGGAVIALLAFVGSILSSDVSNIIRIEAMIPPIRIFAFGVGLSALTSALAYLVNMLDSDISNTVELTWKHPFVNDKPKANILRRWRMAFHYLAMTAAFTSICFFFWGVFLVTGAIPELGF